MDRQWHGERLRKKFSSSVVLPAIPPWLLPLQVIDVGLLERVRDVEEGVYLVVSEHLRIQYCSFLNIFTDGSKDPKQGG